MLLTLQRGPQPLSGVRTNKKEKNDVEKRLKKNRYLGRLRGLVFRAAHAVLWMDRDDSLVWAGIRMEWSSPTPCLIRAAAACSWLRKLFSMTYQHLKPDMLR